MNSQFLIALVLVVVAMILNIVAMLLLIGG